MNDHVSYSFDTLSIASIKKGFNDYGQFPACMGAVDGTQIKVQAPPIDEDIFVGRKTDGHYLNIQLVCTSTILT